MELLNAASIPLEKIHLIEASAGTGKTYNITRIYLRLLLEKQLDVEQILVMTFTKDATEEIKGRIDGFLRESIEQWDTWIESDDKYKVLLAQRIDANSAKLLLQKALVNLDQASIYTIHGFCKRVLTEHAFASGLLFDANMESDDRDVAIQAVEDRYRLFAKQDKQGFVALSEFWPTPDKFLAQFANAIYSDKALSVVDKQAFVDAISHKANGVLQAIDSELDLITRELIDKKSGKDKENELKS